ncbi:MAG TPA: neutral zinc metallopeptidase [Kribbella sp.]|nr:neutral zinc metallopeptidase [Kribbella sp.]
MPGRPSTTPLAEPTDPTQIATKTHFYTTGAVPAVQCVVPRKLVQTRSGMLAYSRVLIGCMQRAWQPSVLRIGYQLDVPRVDAYSVGSSPTAAPLCDYRPSESDGYYVAQSKTICFDWKQLVDKDPVWAALQLQFTVAHEFGHHLQATVGILRSFEFAHAGGSAAVQLEDNRRMELQASCFGAAFLGANKKAFKYSGTRFRVWQYLVEHTGDEYGPKNVRDHGSRKNHGYWSLRAFAAADPKVCNTFTAPAAKVS